MLSWLCQVKQIGQRRLSLSGPMGRRLLGPILVISFLLVPTLLISGCSSNLPTLPDSALRTSASTAAPDDRALTSELSTEIPSEEQAPEELDPEGLAEAELARLFQRNPDEITLEDVALVLALSNLSPAEAQNPQILAQTASSLLGQVGAIAPNSLSPLPNLANANFANPPGVDVVDVAVLLAALNLQGSPITQQNLAATASNLLGQTIAPADILVIPGGSSVTPTPAATPTPAVTPTPASTPTPINETGQVRGFVWSDLNGDGVRNNNEPGLPNRQIFGDRNQNGQLDPNEVNTTTDANGRYTLTLTAGPITIAEVPQANSAQTFPKTQIALGFSDIVGGTTAQEGAYPWMTQLNIGNGFCGGTLIRPDWVLTAAHCLVNLSGQVAAASTIRARVGALDFNGGTPVAVEEVQIFPGYRVLSDGSLVNDVALLRLSTPVNNPTLNLLIPEATSLAAPGINSTVIGFGTIAEGSSSFPQQLQQVNLPIVSNEICQQSLQGNFTISDVMLCAGFSQGGRDACQGDSGGPLLVRDSAGRGLVQAGIVSFGDGCARPNRFGVYTRLSRFVSFVDATLGTPDQNNGRYQATIVANQTLTNADFGNRATDMSPQPPPPSGGSPSPAPSPVTLAVHDITSLRGQSSGNNLQIQMSFVDPITAPSGGGERALVGFIYLDTDQNPQTGTRPYSNRALGSDVYIDLFSETVNPGQVAVINSVSGSTLMRVNANYSGRNLTLTIPLELIGGDPNVNFVGEIGNIQRPTDIIPNSGVGILPGTVNDPVGDTFQTLNTAQRQGDWR